MEFTPNHLVTSIGSLALIALPAFNVMAQAPSHEKAVNVSQAQSTQELAKLINIALENDGNRKQFFAQSEAMRETGIASATLMDRN